MEQNELLQILSETTSVMVTLIRANLKRMGESTAEKLRQKISSTYTTDGGEIEESDGYRPRIFTIEEQVQFNTVITNVIRLMLLNRLDVRDYCTQCLTALLDILGAETNVQKFECPQSTVELYYKLVEGNIRENAQLLDKLSQIGSILFNNLNIQS